MFVIALIVIVIVIDGASVHRTNLSPSMTAIVIILIVVMTITIDGALEEKEQRAIWLVEKSFIHHNQIMEGYQCKWDALTLCLHLA